MTFDLQFSRPARLAATLADWTEEQAAQLFTQKRVLVRIDDTFAAVYDARETFLFALNQILRFCPNVSLALPRSLLPLAVEANELKAEINENASPIDLISGKRGFQSFDAIVNVGDTIVDGLPWITVNRMGGLRVSPHHLQALIGYPGAQAGQTRVALTPPVAWELPSAS